MFDIVIPVGLNDKEILEKQIIYTKRNIIGYRNIYIITNIQELKLENCIIVSEDIFPFSIETISKFHGKNDRNGWYLQQLLKLYAGLVIPNILERYLVIDSDTFFFKPTEFIKEDKCLYNYGREYHIPYFEHMKKLLTTLYRQIEDKSGICHHMIFETKYIKELFSIIESNHNGDKFYNIFLKNVDISHILYSGASEYEIYFNYMILNHPTEIIIRKLEWTNSSSLLENSNYDYISIHYYMRSF